MLARGLPILLLCSIASSAQNVFVPLEGPRAAAAENVFERVSTVPAMKCAFRPSAPILTFRLQYEAAYTMDFSVEQTSWPPHELDIFLRLQLDQADEKPMYMGSRYIPPPQLAPRARATLTARFPLSPGDWRIDALAVDEDGKACHATWRALTRDPAPVPPNPQRRLHRITVFVISDVVYSKVGVLPSPDHEMLAGSLSALLRAMPSELARVVVCNVDSQKESFRSDKFQPADVAQAAKAIEATGAGTVDVSTLRNPQLRLDFLARLINRELRESDPSDVVVFLGAAQQPLRMPRQMIALGGAHPVFVYIQYSAPRYSGSSNAPRAPRQICNDGDTGGSCIVVPADGFNPRLRLAPPAIRDSISNAVSILGGQTIAVATPAEFAKSLARITGAAGR